MRTSRVVLALLLASSSAAQADTKAWTAAKKVLPSSPIVGGMNVAAARSSQLYQQVLPMMMSQAGAAKDQLEAIKKACGIDMLDVIDSVALGVDDSGKGAFVIAIKGTTRKDLESCAQKRAAAGGKTFSTKADGGLTVYTNFDGSGDFYVKWLGPDVFAVSTSPDDKSATAKLLGGGIASDKTFKARVASVNTDAVVWGVMAKKQALDDKTTMNAAYGSVNLAKGNVDANVHVVVTNAQEATAFAAGLVAKLAEARGTKPPPTGALADVLKSVAVKTASSEVIVAATFPEQDVFELVGMLAGAMH